MSEQWLCMREIDRPTSSLAKAVMEKPILIEMLGSFSEIDG
jgi:hypothetical protein